MNIKAKFDHFNIDVTDLDKSEKFYHDALGLTKSGEIKAPDGSFVIHYLSAPDDSFRLELTWLRDHPGHYELGENESHLAMRVDGDYEAIRDYHRKMGVICYENHEMGIYFIHDPDDYWIEILPSKK